MLPDQTGRNIPNRLPWDDPPYLHLDIPSPARFYDYLLGGKDNFQVDREAAEKLKAKLPEAAYGAEINREFLRLIVRHLVTVTGIRQFLDIGAGLPTVDNTHQVAQRAAPEARVVYVDNDPLVLAHGRALLSTNSLTLVVQGDLCDPQGILKDPEVQGHIDFTRPVAVLLIAVMHFVPDQGIAKDIVQTLRHQLAPGSYIVMSHFASVDGRDVESAQEAYSQSVTPVRARTVREVQDLFDGLELVPPGVAHVSEWLTSKFQEVVSIYDSSRLSKLPLLCAVGRKEEFR